MIDKTALRKAKKDYETAVSVLQMAEARGAPKSEIKELQKRVKHQRDRYNYHKDKR